MGKRVVHGDTIWVAFGQAYVRSTDEPPRLDRAFGGQENGLCGAATPGGLFLVTGLHTGRVGFTVEVHDTAPPLGAEWEEIVEASFTPTTSEVVLAEWGGGAGDSPYPLGLTSGDWRVRYSGTGMDAAHGAGPPGNGEDPVDRYLLQFWPASPTTDRVVRQTSDKAAYWHDTARRMPPAPPPPTAEELAEVERREQRVRRAARERSEARKWWGGRPPSDRLRHVGGSVWDIAQHDRDLLDELDRAGTVVQRQVAVWAAHRACEVAGLSSMDWIAAALDALGRGEPLPDPFDDLGRAFDRLRGGPRNSTVTLPSSPVRRNLRPGSIHGTRRCPR